MISIAHILIAALGVVAGIVFGAIPGMTATMAYRRTAFGDGGKGGHVSPMQPGEI